MDKKYMFLGWIFLVSVFMTLVYTSSGFAAKRWHEYYNEGQRALKAKAYATAIELFEKAIELEPDASKKKRSGMRTIKYFPYYSLGYAYLGTGGYETAHYYCTLAKEKEAAPSKAVDECLAFASQYVTPSSNTLPSTPTLSPTPTAASQQQAPPRIQLISKIPSRTSDESLNIQGLATDDDGVKQVKVINVDRFGMTRTARFRLPERQQELLFKTSIHLGKDRNTIIIEAIDTQGQISKQEFVVTRSSSVASAPEQIPTISAPIDLPTPLPIQKPTPKPTPIPTPLPTRRPTPIPTSIPTPRTDSRPVIKVRSDMPAETTADTLEIWGFVSDDHGIREVKVNVKHVGKKGLVIAAPAKRVQEKFTAHAKLTVGENTITVEAFDTGGQRATQTFTVFRRSLPPPKLEPTPFVAKIEDESGGIQRPGNVYAVIIGIGNYQDPQIPDLDYTVNDAQGLYDILTDPDYGGIPKDQIALLLNEQATYSKIKAALGKWLPQQARPEDTVIIYYSGHGAPEGRSFYWVTHNADIDDLYATAMNNNEIAGMLDRIESDRVITFLDSCYSAATVNRTLKTRSISTEIPWEKFSGKGRVAISASDGKQLSLELDEYKHGVFTYYLLEGLRGKADENSDGVIEVDEVWDYVKHQVREIAKKSGNPQTPVLQGSLTAGIPITFNLPLLRQQKQANQVTHKLQQLEELFEGGKILPQHFNCAYKILKSGEYNLWVESLLSGAVDPEIFNDSFQCR